MKEKLHWLPIAARIDFKIILIIQKALICESPEYLCDHLIPSRSNRLVHFRSEGGHEFAKRSFHISAPVLYSKIPEIMNDLTIPTFKENLKTYLYMEAFENKLDSILFYGPTEQQRHFKLKSDSARQ